MRNELDVLLDKVDDSGLRADLRLQIERIQAKRRFGLLFESHLPERVRLPDHPIRRGATVALRDRDDSPTFEVLNVVDETVTMRKMRNGDGTALDPEDAAGVVDEMSSRASVVVITDFGEPIYPGLRHLGSLTRGGDRTSHVVIEGENYHVLQMLQFTHVGKIDCIYIDPPYNSGGGQSWKYDNNYVDPDDAYRHSKWLAFMERRLKLAKDLLNPERSVLIVAIDENEVHRLALLLQQLFVGERIQMVTTVVNPRGKYREGEFSRCDEYLFFVMVGDARASGEPDEDYSEGAGIGWRTLRRSDITSKRGTSKGGKSQFYPIYIDNETRRIVEVGDPLPHDVNRDTAPTRKGCTAVFPIRDDGTESFLTLVPVGGNRRGRTCQRVSASGIATSSSQHR